MKLLSSDASSGSRSRANLLLELVLLAAAKVHGNDGVVLDVNSSVCALLVCSRWVTATNIQCVRVLVVLARAAHLARKAVARRQGREQADRVQRWKRY